MQHVKIKLSTHIIGNPLNNANGKTKFVLLFQKQYYKQGTNNIYCIQLSSDDLTNHRSRLGD